MPTPVNIAKFISLSKCHTVIDVRSPAEFIDGHIPGAFNIPLFDNEERKIVGTIYKQEGRRKAIVKGFEFVGIKMAALIEDVKQLSDNDQILVYCWRGGMRSASMAWWFERNGFQCKTLLGGYKSYRRYAQNFFNQKFQFLVLGGLTGSGKTSILHFLKDKGEQVIDLEKLASHKGSAFGSLGEPDQPKTEHFENLLFEDLSLLDTDKRIWIEDESHNIGKVSIPKSIYVQIRSSTVICIKPDVESRLDQLVDDYGGFPKEGLKASIERIGKRIGGQNLKEALTCLEEGNYRRVAEIALAYYDKTYTFGLEKRNPGSLCKIDLGSLTGAAAAEKILARVNKQIFFSDHTNDLQ
jgi:tRNA 2-selenouridine synthase